MPCWAAGLLRLARQMSHGADNISLCQAVTTRSITTCSCDISCQHKTHLLMQTFVSSCSPCTVACAGARYCLLLSPMTSPTVIWRCVDRICICIYRSCVTLTAATLSSQMLSHYAAAIVAGAVLASCDQLFYGCYDSLSRSDNEVMR